MTDPTAPRRCECLLELDNLHRLICPRARTVRRPAARHDVSLKRMLEQPPEPAHLEADLDAWLLEREQVAARLACPQSKPI